MDIDFVVAWVDGNDPEWNLKKSKYKNDDASDSSVARYRDWDIFQYWFRSIEQNAPWVHKVYLVTDHQIPKFLNINHPKMKIIYHDDYIPREYLPTFSANPIELNFHRIEGLSEYFVYFNDDMFLNRPLKPEDFFVKGKPCYEFIERPIAPIAPASMIQHICFNDMSVINKNFSRKNIMKHPHLFLNYRYGKHAVKNLFMLPWSNYQHFQDNHMPCPFLKSTLCDVWNKNNEIMDSTSRHKFRSYEDVNQYVFKYWDLARGNFHPFHFESGYYSVNESNIGSCVADILSGNHKMICINDAVVENLFEKLSNSVKRAFEERYPIKCSFEV